MKNLKKIISELSLLFSVIAITVLFVKCSVSSPLLEPDKDDYTQKSPEKFSVQFITTKGNFTVEVDREYAPLAADRFYYLVKNNYYSFNRFFRVVPNFVVQWGMKGVPAIDTIWENLGVLDEPVKLSNTKGTLAFARSGPKTRSNQLYINLADNVRLDTSSWNGVNGFPAFGKVTKGMDIIESITSEYEQQPNQDSIKAYGNRYLIKNFPNLDYIKSVKIISEE